MSADPLAATHVAALGFRRAAGAGELVDLVEACLAEAGLGPAALAALVTLEGKHQAPAILAAAACFGVPVRGLGRAAIEAVARDLPPSSPRVAAAIGLPALAEAAAIACGTLILSKRRSPAATCALARLAEPPGTA